MNLDEAPEPPGSTAPAEPPPAPAPSEASVSPEIIVAIPGRRPDDALIDLVVPDQEVADRVRQLVKSGLRREHLNSAMAALEDQRDEIERQRRELAFVEEHLELDPVGFLLDRVRPEIQVNLAKHLLSIPEVFVAVREELADWQDEEVRARRQTELRVTSATDRPGDLERIRALPMPAAPVEGPRLPPRTVKARRVS